MLHFSTQFTKMHRLLLMMVMMMWAFIAMTAAQCDPLRQYEKDGVCCEKCPPGNSMTSLSTCEEPQCTGCGEKEYQDVYTTESKCKRQPYCDPNKNFEVADYNSKTKRIHCMCKVGFHCSSENCLTCVPHSKCGPGNQIVSKGNQTLDTVCQKCPKGTFSTEPSLDRVCKKWTECGSGYHIQQNGTAISDNVCVENSRQHRAVIFALISLLLIVLTVGFVVWLCRGPAKGKVKGCVESCIGGERKPLKDEVLIANPTTDHLCVEPKDSVMQFSQDDSTMTPEENEDELSQEATKTEKGNYVMQENGKAEVISRQESQTHHHIDL